MSFSGTFCIDYFDFYSSTVYKEIFFFFNVLEFLLSDHLNKLSAHRILEPDVYQAVYNFNEDGSLHNIGLVMFAFSFAVYGQCTWVIVSFAY